MKEIRILFQSPSACRSDTPSDRQAIPSECLAAAAKLFECLCCEPDFRQRMNDFLTKYHWEVPMESWQPPPDTSPNGTPCPTER